MTKTSGIYLITNTVTKKVYVGSSVDIKARWKEHLSSLRKGRHHSVKLQRSWDKHGEDIFKFEVIEPVENVLHLVAIEQTFIDYHKAATIAGYNVSPTAGSPLGVRHSEETKEKQRIASTGRKHSEETKAMMSAIHMGKPGTTNGRSHSDETRAKISAATKGVKKSVVPVKTEAHKKAIGDAHRGKRKTPEHIAALIASRNPKNYYFNKQHQKWKIQ